MKQYSTACGMSLSTFVLRSRLVLICADETKYLRTIAMLYKFTCIYDGAKCISAIYILIFDLLNTRHKSQVHSSLIEYRYSYHFEFLVIDQIRSTYVVHRLMDRMRAGVIVLLAVVVLVVLCALEAESRPSAAKRSYKKREKNLRAKSSKRQQEREEEMEERDGAAENVENEEEENERELVLPSGGGRGK